MGQLVHVKDGLVDKLMLQMKESMFIANNFSAIYGKIHHLKVEQLKRIL